MSGIHTAPEGMNTFKAQIILPSSNPQAPCQKNLKDYSKKAVQDSN